MSAEAQQLEREPDVILFNIRNGILDLVADGINTGLNTAPSRIFRAGLGGTEIILSRQRDFPYLHHPFIVIDANDEIASGELSKAEQLVAHLKNVLCGNIADPEPTRRPLVVVLGDEPGNWVYRLLQHEQGLKAEPLLFEKHDNAETLSRKFKKIWDVFLHPESNVQSKANVLDKLLNFFEENFDPWV